MKILLHICYTLLLILYSGNTFSQNRLERYNVDSFISRITANPFLKANLKKADAIYRDAKIDPANVSLNAFRIAFLEKALLDAEKPDKTEDKHYKQSNTLSVVDFTRQGNRKRLVIIDLSHRKIIQSSLVSHGSAYGKNKKEGIPAYFSNRDSSYCSSLGMIVVQEEAYPETLCHLCRFFLDKQHKCGLILEGLEEGINDRIKEREIVVHTTGSKDYSDSFSLAKIKKLTGLTEINDYQRNDGCTCFKSDTTKTSAYASDCVIKESNGFIGRSLGCFALSEDNHMKVMKALKPGSLIFVYTDVAMPGSTDYFNESPIIKRMSDLKRQEKKIKRRNFKHR